MSERHPGRRITRGMFCAAIIAAAVVLGSFVLAGWSFYRGHEQACQRSDASLAVLADILQQARPSKAEFASMSLARKRRTIRFYSFADTRIAQARC